jgi:hypothetical protein
VVGFDREHAVVGALELKALDGGLEGSLVPRNVEIRGGGGGS